jgi:hypothetical protein
MDADECVRSVSDTSGDDGGVVSTGNVTVSVTSSDVPRLSAALSANVYVRPGFMSR